MLLFIPDWKEHDDLPCEFQYITCYSLSHLAVNTAVCISSFNTSHVTLYQEDDTEHGTAFSFQYITCYSLSNTGHKHVKADITFQYITCYSLSKQAVKYMGKQGSFNTSHVTLYHWNFSSFNTGCFSFNTSHVTLYRPFRTRTEPYKARFNTSHVTLYHHRHFSPGLLHSFQYITCYSLSGAQVQRTTLLNSFNTSHVTLYPRCQKRIRRMLQVSIHHMLLFITIFISNRKFYRIVSIHHMLLFILQDPSQ